MLLLEAVLWVLYIALLIRFINREYMTTKDRVCFLFIIIVLVAYIFVSLYNDWHLLID